MFKKIIFFLLLFSRDFVYCQSQLNLSLGAGIGLDKYSYYKEWDQLIDKFQKPFSKLTYFPIIGLEYFVKRYKFFYTVAYSERKFDFLTFSINGFPPVEYYYYKSLDFALRFSFLAYKELSIGTSFQYSFINNIKYSYLGVSNLDFSTAYDSHAYFLGYHIGWSYRNIDLKVEYFPHSFIFPKVNINGPDFYPISHAQRIQIFASYSFKLFELKNNRKTKINCPKI